VAQHLAISTFDLAANGRVIERPPKRSQRGFEGMEPGGRRKSSQIELTGIKIQTDTMTRMDSLDAEETRYSKATSSHQQNKCAMRNY
jgi:hypothetical protein